MPLEWVVYSVLIGATLLFLAKYLVDRSVHRRAYERHREVLKRDIELIKGTFRSLFEKSELLNDHTTTYFHSLHEAGLGRLNEVQQNVERAIGDCERLIHEGDLEGAQELERFLSRPGNKSYPRVQSLTSADLRLVEDWERVANDIVLACVIRLSESSDQSTAIGLERSGGERKTCHTLDELKRLLGVPSLQTLQ